MRKIKRRDEVIVIAGRDKGKRGEVLQVLADGRLKVAGVNLVKRHTKANPYTNSQGGIHEQEAPIDASNVAIFNPDTERADRVGFRFNDEGRKERFFKSTRKAIDA